MRKTVPPTFVWSLNPDPRDQDQASVSIPPTLMRGAQRAAEIAAERGYRLLRCVDRSADGAQNALLRETRPIPRG